MVKLYCLFKLSHFNFTKVYFIYWENDSSPLINILYFLMINKLTLNAAVSKVYGKALTPCRTPLTEWQLFLPYSSSSTEPPVLLQLLEVPAYFYTSEQICSKSLEKFKDILHKVKMIFIERCFQSSYYLLMAQENLIPISSLLKIKREASEKVEEEVIFNYLQFLSKLECHPFSNHISFNQQQIGIDSKGNFVLANYLMYFQYHSKEDNQAAQNNFSKSESFARDGRRVLVELITPNSDNLDMSSFYITVAQKYGTEMMKLIQKCMEPTFKFCQISPLINSIRRCRGEESFSATVTDSFLEDGEKMSDNLMNVTCNSAAIDENYRKIKKREAAIKRRKSVGFVVVFIIILIGIGAITFKYLKPRPLQCDESQYPDEESMKCLNCDSSCEKCLGGESTMCVSCKGNFYLIIHDTHDKTGRCSQVCHGTIIKTKTCIDSH